MIITRFAPSPTGSPHLGNIRTAFFSWILANQKNGKFILRIEDTDKKRRNYKFVLDIIDALLWLGLDYEEGPISPKTKSDLSPENWNQKGKNGPYFQSQRLEIYQKYIKILLKKGLVYYCFCSKERLDKIRKIQLKKGEIPKYDGFCRNLSKNEVIRNLKKNKEYVIRLKIPKNNYTFVYDEIRGKIRFKNKLQEDSILIKSDGYPTYHFASVVDDHLMNVNYVIRGDEWISSFPKHIILYKYLNFKPPKFIHLPIILGKDKSKLSKRHNALSILEYKKLGYLKEAILNFIALLGWSPKENREILSLKEIIRKFKIQNLIKSPAIFNEEKLKWLNGVYIRNLPIKELKKEAAPFLKKFNIKKFKDKIDKILIMAQTRVKVLSEIPDVIDFIFKLPDYPTKILIVKDKKHTIKSLNFSYELIKKTDDFSKKNLKEYFIKKITERKYKTKEILWPLRVALSGKEKSPDVFEIMEVLEKQECMKRINQAISKLLNY